MFCGSGVNSVFWQVVARTLAMTAATFRAGASVSPPVLASSEVMAGSLLRRE
jgi:hypothetical protein